MACQLRAGKVDEPGRPGRVVMWMVPRTVSTSFAKCMTGIPGAEIWLEPLGYCYFAEEFYRFAEKQSLPPEYEGNEESYSRAATVLGAQLGVTFPPDRLSRCNIKKRLEESTSKYVFVKDQGVAMHSDTLKQYLPAGFQHAFLIRHPDLVYASLRTSFYSLRRNKGNLPAQVDEEGKYDMRLHEQEMPPELFYIYHHSLWKYVREHFDPNPVVIDASDLQSKPAEVLSKFCERVGLPYSESLLQWDTSLEMAKTWKWPSDDLIHNKEFLETTRASGKFLPLKQPPSRDTLADDVIEISDKVMPLYQEMYLNRLKV